MQRDWDYIIIGAGSAGSTLASRLSQNPACSVLLVEAGGRDLSAQIKVPGLLEGALTNPALSWSYLGEPDPTLNGRRLTWAAGRVVGGSSSINGMVYGRGLPADYDRWAADGAAGWGWSDMAPYFKRIEHWTGPPDARRGQDGPLWVRRFDQTDPSCAAAMQALIDLGVPPVDDYSVGIAEGIGLTQATQKKGWRHSAANAYLGPAWRRGNLTVMTGAQAQKLLFDGLHCLGVRVFRRGKTIDLHARCETIVSAGAIGAPKLLLLSGVGPAEELKALGIEVVHNLPGVGRGLNDHVNIKLSAHVHSRTYNTRRKGLSALGEGLRFAINRSGAAASPANHVQAFVRTDPESPVADVQLQIMPFGFGSDAEMARDGLTVVVSPCQPEVRGAVTLGSADPDIAPKITIALLDSERDRARLLRGCRLALQALQQGPVRAFGGQVYAPRQNAPTDEEWLTFFRQTAALNWH
ncbi:MAG TPA: GMC family oxidoreductase N-terminal domain-containing protein, partial [Caulobacteraceae bacterium]|nr:GMC family oxidoreductase N-terminal domain-containing protein [Caulobacteraceae bacterium]